MKTCHKVVWFTSEPFWSSSRLQGFLITVTEDVGYILTEESVILVKAYLDGHENTLCVFDHASICSPVEFAIDYISLHEGCSQRLLKRGWNLTLLTPPPPRLRDSDILPSSVAWTGINEHGVELQPPPLNDSDALPPQRPGQGLIQRGWHGMHSSPSALPWDCNRLSPGNGVATKIYLFLKWNPDGRGCTLTALHKPT